MAAIKRRTSANRWTLIGLTAVVFVVVGCSSTGDDDPSDVAGGNDPVQDDEDTGTQRQTGVEPIADGGTIADQEAQGEAPGESTGRAQAVTDVRVATHDGFDRVVFELTSDGSIPGWYIGYDEPRAQGSGELVEVTGDAVMVVTIHPVVLPPELPEGIETYDRPTLDGPDGGVVREIVNGSVFEGYHQLFVGVDAARTFAVGRMQDPTRVVVDIFHDET